MLFAFHSHFAPPPLTFHNYILSNTFTFHLLPSAFHFHLHPFFIFHLYLESLLSPALDLHLFTFSPLFFICSHLYHSTFTIPPLPSLVHLPPSPLTLTFLAPFLSIPPFTFPFFAFFLSPFIQTFHFDLSASTRYSPLPSFSFCFLPFSLPTSHLLHHFPVPSTFPHLYLEQWPLPSISAFGHSLFVFYGKTSCFPLTLSVHSPCPFRLSPFACGIHL